MNYSRIYDELISRAYSENRVKGNGIYYEKHHIIPRCIGGNNSKLNLVLLTAREHFIAHKLLGEIYPNESGIIHAIFFMSYKTLMNRLYKVSSREYERHRSNHIKTTDWSNMSNETKKRISESLVEYFKNNMHYNKGKNISEETKEKLRKANLGKIKSEESKLKQSESVIKTWNSEEYADKREIQRIRAIEMVDMGKIGAKFFPRDKKGKPFSGDRNMLSNSLKKYLSNEDNRNAHIIIHGGKWFDMYSIKNIVLGKFNRVISFEQDKFILRSCDVKKIADEYSLRRKTIIDCLNNKRLTYKGYEFRCVESE